MDAYELKSKFLKNVVHVCFLKTENFKVNIFTNDFFLRTHNRKVNVNIETK